MTDQMSPALASRQRRRIIDDAAQGLGVARGAHLSTRGGRLRLINANDVETLVPNHHLDVVVVDANDRASRIYFDLAKPFDPLNPEPPLCFSDNGTGPSTLAMQPQAPTCQACSHNVRGSDTTFTGKPTTACSNRKKLAFIVPDDPAVNVYEMQIPPGSLTGLRDYTNWLKQQSSGIQGRQLDIADVVTRVEFDPDRQFVMTFKAVGYADDDYTLKVIDYIDAEKLSDVAVGRNDVAIEPSTFRLAAPAQRPALAAPEQKPAQDFGSLPPRGAPAQLEAPAAAAQEAPKPRAPRKPKEDAPASNGAAPFMASATKAATTGPSAVAETGTASRSDDGIPSFLRRSGEAPAPSAPTPRFGVGQAPTPPGPILDAVNAAMGLPSRRA